MFIITRTIHRIVEDFSDWSGHYPHRHGWDYGAFRSRFCRWVWLTTRPIVRLTGRWMVYWGRCGC